MANEGRTVFEAALTAQREGRAAALVTIIATQGSVPRQPGSKMLVWENGQIVGTIGGGEMEAFCIQEAQAALLDGQTRLLRYNLNDLASGDPGVCGGTVQLFVEPLTPPPTVIVIGCGHVGKAVADLAKWADFRVIVADDRPGFATPEQIPGMDAYIEAPLSELIAQLNITTRTCVAALTRGLPVDRELIPALLKTNAPYIGLIGSRRRWALTMQTLIEDGLSQADVQRVHAPIGLDIGAETPKEIALSILAEIIMALHGGSGEAKQWTGHPPDIVQ